MPDIPDYHPDPINAKASKEAEDFFNRLRGLCQRYDVLFCAGASGQIIARMYHKDGKGVETFDLGPVLNANTYPDFPIGKNARV